jgi:hypothetical protein
MDARRPEFSAQDRLDIPFLPAFSAHRTIFLVHDSRRCFSLIYLPWLSVCGRRDWTTLRYDLPRSSSVRHAHKYPWVGYDEVREFVHDPFTYD